VLASTVFTYIVEQHQK